MMMMAGIFGRSKSRATKSGHDRPSEVGHAAMPSEAASPDINARLARR